LFVVVRVFRRYHFETRYRFGVEIPAATIPKRHEFAARRAETHLFSIFAIGRPRANLPTGEPFVSTSAVALKPTRAASDPITSAKLDAPPRRRLDLSMLAGIVIALTATIAGIAATGVKLTYFVQPTGALIVLGGTFGVMFITTPLDSLLHSIRRVAGLLWSREVDRVELLEEIMTYVRTARTVSLLGLEPMIARTKNAFLAESLTLAIDVQQRAELQTALETKIRMREREGEHDAKILEVAGGFAPTIGVMGTVVGLIDILRQFSNLASVANGIGMAFVSTIYGLGLANLILLPAAGRIRARTAVEFEAHELIMEGVMCLFDGLHPSLVRDRLMSHLRAK
jgi:chemotaxis protein MotA